MGKWWNNAILFTESHQTTCPAKSIQGRKYFCRKEKKMPDIRGILQWQHCSQFADMKINLVPLLIHMSSHFLPSTRSLCFVSSIDWARLLYVADRKICWIFLAINALAFLWLPLLLCPDLLTLVVFYLNVAVLQFGPFIKCFPQQRGSISDPYYDP